ncbi:MAG TPA: leucyl/phenylalanyl-tRNA--protein transferase [Chthoniobacteraceae bacterium]|jgi:leucyl/phenylalanyl-tRNA--protein transferase|nr:leucyl/phenylalanyl-tRNA--protein transferase [Chthoniobacteraceae bacterium]
MISPALLIEGYLHGVFPMGMEAGEIGWFSPDPRAIIPLDDSFHVPHGLKRALARGTFEVQINQRFEEVMQECARRKETWITGEIVESYCELHRRGFAHSVEAWCGGQLAGGLYGVAIGGAFFGESMFHRQTDASKVALHGLVQRLRERGFSLLDTQWITPHLKQFGAMEIPRRQYLRRLAESTRLSCLFQ